MTDEDEREFLTFLRTIAPIQLLEYTAPTKELIWVDEFAPRHQGHWKYVIWNQAFPWQAEYGRILESAVVQERKGWFYLSNTSVAPVIEYSRHNFKDLGGVTGRIYWAKQVSIEDTVAYDATMFSKWFDVVVRWIRKNGRQRLREPYAPYFLADAWQKTFGDTTQ